MNNHKGWANDVTILSDKHVVSCGNDCSIKFNSSLLYQHSDYVKCCQKYDGVSILSAGLDKVVKKFDDDKQLEIILKTLTIHHPNKLPKNLIFRKQLFSFKNFRQHIFFSDKLRYACSQDFDVPLQNIGVFLMMLIIFLDKLSRYWTQ